MGIMKKQLIEELIEDENAIDVVKQLSKEYRCVINQNI